MSDHKARIHAVRAQIDAARLRREELVASGQLSGLSADPSAALYFPGYTVLRELHRGGQGVVYAAVQQSTDRQVALKVLRHGPFAGPAEVARFEREVEVLSRLKHPNMVTIHDCGRAGEDVYLVMDYVAGRPLDAHIAHERPSIRDTLDLFAKVCDGVNAAHLRGVIHRDLKPGNIFVVCDDEEGLRTEDSGLSKDPVLASAEPKILDFGLAKLARESGDASSAGAMTLTGQFVGSLPWASPEQAEGRSDALDIRTDVYSLGVILYQLLTGRFPYPVSGRIDDVVRHIVQTSPARPSTVDRGIDHEVETILLKCLAKEPDRRYQSAGELARDLRRYLANEPIEAKRDSLRYVLRKQLRRHWVGVAVATSFALLLAGGLITSLMLWRRAEQTLVEKEEQRKLAERRAEETKQVTDFQSRMLGEIDVDAMGRGIQESFREQVRAALERQYIGEWPNRRKRTQAEVEAELEAYDERAGAAQTVDVARRVMDDYVLKRAINSLETDLTDQPLVQAQIRSAISDAYDALGMYDAAEPYRRQVLEIRRRELGDDQPDTLQSMSDMGSVLFDQGRLDDAEVHFRDALERSRSVLGEEHALTLGLLNNMGGVLMMRGRLAEAEPYFRESLATRRRVFGESHPEMVRLTRNLGGLLQRQGRLAEAEPLLHEGLEHHRRILGDEHPDTFSSISSLAALLKSQGKLEEAEILCRESAETSRRVLGDEHPDALSSNSDLGLILMERGKLDAAEPFLREVLEASRRILGDEHPDTLLRFNNMASLLERQGKLAEAESLYREALEARRRVLGNEHPGTLNSLNNLGSLLQAQGKLTEAEPLYREALETRRRVLGDGHLDTLVSLSNLAGFLLALNKPAEAEPLYREVLAGRLEKLPPGHRSTAIARVGLGRALMKLAADASLTIDARATKLAQAETLLVQAWQVVADDAGAPAAVRERTLRGLVELYETWHAAEPDQRHDAEAAEWREKLAEWRASTQPAGT